MGNRDEHCRIRPHRDTVMAVWEAYRGGTELVETNGPIVARDVAVSPEAASDPGAGRERRVVPERPVAMASESAGDADRV